MQTIAPHLWFDKEAKQAAELCTSIFKDSQIKNTATLHDTPSGTVDLLSIELLGQEFKLINAGPPLSSLLPYRFSLRVTQKMKLIHFGTVSRKTARLSWNSVNIRSAKDTDGHRTGTAFHGK